MACTSHRTYPLSWPLVRSGDSIEEVVARSKSAVRRARSRPKPHGKIRDHQPEPSWSFLNETRHSANQH